MLGEPVEWMWQPYQQLAVLPWLERPVAGAKGLLTARNIRALELQEIFGGVGFRPRMPSGKPWHDIIVTRKLVQFLPSPTTLIRSCLPPSFAMAVQSFTSEKFAFPKRSCGVLGATGSVGQRFILLLANHPHFELTVVGASKRSAGQKYKDAAKWKQAQPMSKELGNLVVQECVPEAFKTCDIVFSGLDSDVAGDIGPL